MEEFALLHFHSLYVPSPLLLWSILSLLLVFYKKRHHDNVSGYEDLPFLESEVDENFLVCLEQKKMQAADGGALHFALWEFTIIVLVFV